MAFVAPAAGARREPRARGLRSLTFCGDPAADPCGGVVSARRASAARSSHTRDGTHPQSVAADGPSRRALPRSCKRPRSRASSREPGAAESTSCGMPPPSFQRVRRRRSSSRASARVGAAGRARHRRRRAGSQRTPTVVCAVRPGDAIEQPVPARNADLPDRCGLGRSFPAARRSGLRVRVSRAARRASAAAAPSRGRRSSGDSARTPLQASLVHSTSKIIAAGLSEIGAAFVAVSSPACRSVLCALSSSLSPRSPRSPVRRRQPAAHQAGAAAAPVPPAAPAAAAPLSDDGPPSSGWPSRPTGRPAAPRRPRSPSSSSPTSSARSARVCTPTLEQIRSTYPNDVRIVFRHNPLPFHADAALAAEAAVAAEWQGKFWEMHDKLFAHQADLGLGRPGGARRRAGARPRRLPQGARQRTPPRRASTPTWRWPASWACAGRPPSSSTAARDRGAAVRRVQAGHRRRARARRQTARAAGCRATSSTPRFSTARSRRCRRAGATASADATVYRVPTLDAPVARRRATEGHHRRVRRLPVPVLRRGSSRRSTRCCRRTDPTWRSSSATTRCPSTPTRMPAALAAEAARAAGEILGDARQALRATSRTSTAPRSTDTR